MPSFNLRQAVEKEIGRLLSEDEAMDAAMLLTIWPEDSPKRIVDFLDSVVTEEVTVEISNREMARLNGSLTAILGLIYLLGKNGGITSVEYD